MCKQCDIQIHPEASIFKSVGTDRASRRHPATRAPHAHDARARATRTDDRVHVRAARAARAPTARDDADVARARARARDAIARGAARARDAGDDVGTRGRGIKLLGEGERGV